MARRNPPIDPTGYYHLSTRGVYGRPMFRDDADHELFLRLYGRTALKHRWVTLAWALIWNHHHFIVKLTDGGLSNGVRALHSNFSRRMHGKYGGTREGHLVRHCFYAGQIKTDEGILAAARYVDLNAVRAGLCERPDEWRWSSYRATLGLEHPQPFHQPHELHRLLGKTPRAARTAYRRYVHEGLVSDSHVLTSEQGYEIA